ncbi:MAG TPA: KTSC domain-containing protein [Stellaceae bacterium]|nr:KTSC domain-containing protein [Stellaceae bacterium]
MTDFRPVSSSTIHSIAYDDERGVMTVRFHRGPPYEYDAPKDVHDRLLAHESPGRFLHHEVKGRFRHRRIG